MINSDWEGPWITSDHVDHVDHADHDSIRVTLPVCSALYLDEGAGRRF